MTGTYSTTKSKFIKNDLKINSINPKFIKKNNNYSLFFYNQNEKEEIKKESPEEYNDLPYTKALKLDKRNIFQLFKSILFEKLELINIFISGEKIRIICICEYILSLLFDFFFNTLLYSDDVVSHKYHNNGQLDTAVSLSISLLSNIITSIVCHFIEYSDGIEEYFELLTEIKKEYKYLYAVNKFIKYLKYKMFFFLLIEIVLVSGCFYYIVIFCILYSKSQKSLFINYLYSLLEGLITSIIITFIVVITRQIGIHYSNSYFYNTSKYINNKF